jgi:hypothetical protein
LFTLSTDKSTNGPISPNVDHLLGLYQTIGIYNGVPLYKQLEARHNLISGLFMEKFEPVHLYIYQVQPVME